MDTEEHTSQHEEMVHYCATHRDVETGLACSRCGKYICPRCMVQTSVGARCRECTRGQRSHIYDVKPTQLALAIVVAAVMAVGLGTAWGRLFVEIQRIPFLPWLVAIGVGYIIGEGVSMVSNRRRATILAWVAGMAVVAAFIITGFVFAEGSGVKFLLRVPFGILTLGIAVYVAVNRVR